MTQFVKFCSILTMCIVTLLIFVNVVEKSVGKGKLDESLDRLRSNDDKRLFDLENFEYTIRPSNCGSTFFTWIVTSYSGDPAPRSALRRAYSKQQLLELGITRVFLLGQLDDARAKQSGVSQASLRNEAERFDDIVQGNFYEAYRNLTYKHLMGLKWASESCENSSYILKQDDDIVTNLYELIEKLKVLRSKNEIILAGYVLRGMKPVREPANKWYVRREEFEKNFYPDFLSGWLYIIDRRSAVKLVRHSRTCGKYFWIDDVFLTGILRHELNIPLIDLRHLYTTDYRYLICCLRGGKKNLNCEFAVGPNGGKIELQLDFQKFAALCRERNCARRNVGKTCVVEYEKDKVEMGSAKIEPVKFL